MFAQIMELEEVIRQARDETREEDVRGRGYARGLDA